MGQFLIVQGEDGGEVRGWFEAGLAVYESLAGLRPADSVADAQTAVALFPRRVSPVEMVRPESARGRWCCGAGTWFYENRGGAEGLRRLLAAGEGGRSATAWLQPIDGAFALALAGARPGVLHVITDRLGSLHLYRARAGSAVLLCTSSLVLAALLRPEWDPVGLRHFLSTGTIFEAHTLYRGIEKLPPATLFSFERGQVAAETRYWSAAGACFDRAPAAGTVAGLAEGLRQAVASVGANYPGAALDLTGGYDSRGLVGAMLQDPSLRFHTVVNGPPGNADVECAARIAAEFGLAHDRFDRGPTDPQRIWDGARESLLLTDGEYDMLLYATVLETHSNLSQRFQASVNGSVGEICKGQWWEVLLPHIGRRNAFDARAVAAARFAYGTPAEPLLNFSFEEDVVEDFAGIIRRATAGMEQYPNTALMDCCYLTLRMQRWQGRLMSATSRIWPVASPYAFRQPMEMALAAPVKLRVRHRLSRRLIEYQNPRLAALPLAQGYPALPVRWNTLHRFWPLAVETGRLGVGAALRMAGLRGRRQVYSDYPLARVAHLEEVRDALEWKRMLTRDLYRGEAAQRLIAGQTAFAGRILTVEMAARLARDAAPRPVSGRARPVTEPAG